MNVLATMHKELRAGLRQTITGLSGLPEMAWQGRPFTETVGTAFIREKYMPIYSRKASVGKSSVLAHRIVYLLTLFYPANSGTNDMDEMAGALMKLLEPGTSIAYGTSDAKVEEVEQKDNGQEPNWISCTITTTLAAYSAG